MILLPTLLLTLAAIASPVHLSSEQQVAVLQEAQTAYELGIELQTSDPVASKEAFRRSANRFNVLVNDGIENGKLWYDLGNAQLQSGEIGESIAAYLSAKRYIPSDGRVEANLEYARSSITYPITGESSTSMLKRLAFWHTSLPTQVRLALGLTIWCSFWACVTIRLFRVIPGFKTVTIMLGLSAMAFGVSVGADIADQYQGHGVLTAQEVIVRKGNGLNYDAMFKEPIHEGIEFKILGRRSNWLHIQLPNGVEGWIEKDNAQIVTLSSESKKHS